MSRNMSNVVITLVRRMSRRRKKNDCEEEEDDFDAVELRSKYQRRRRAALVRPVREIAIAWSTSSAVANCHKRRATRLSN